MFNIPVEHQVCRVVQIRKEIGQFGSDMFFVRHADGSLVIWENQMFHKVKPEYIQKIQTVYNRPDAIEIDDDRTRKEYRLQLPGNEEYITGFIHSIALSGGSCNPNEESKSRYPAAN